MLVASLSKRRLGSIAVLLSLAATMSDNNIRPMDLWVKNYLLGSGRQSARPIAGAIVANFVKKRLVSGFDDSQCGVEHHQLYKLPVNVSINTLLQRKDIQ